MGVPHHDVLDVPSAVDQYPNLSSHVVACLCQLARQLLCHQPIARNTTPMETSELTDLAGLETLRVPEDLGHASVTFGSSRGGRLCAL